MKTYISWSGGKDSTASIILAHELGMKIDGVVMVEVMFDHARNISGEEPEHIEWVYKTAIPIIEQRFGYKVIMLRDKSDYMQEFYHKIQKSKVKSRVGKFAGFFIGGMCVGNNRLKMRPLNRFFRQDCEQIVGIAKDEPKRLKRLKPNCRSILAENNITEKMAYEMCQKHGLLSPIYQNNFRGGCWFCPNQSIKEFARLNRNYPKLYNELEKLSKSDNLASKGFRYGLTFSEVDEQVKLINNQISFFD